MGKDDFHPLLLKCLDPRNGFLRLMTVCMDAAQVAGCVTPLPNLLLPAYDAAVVTGIAGQVDPLARTTFTVMNTGQQVYVAR